MSTSDNYWYLPSRFSTPTGTMTVGGGTGGAAAACCGGGTREQYSMGLLGSGRRRGGVVPSPLLPHRPSLPSPPSSWPVMEMEGKEKLVCVCVIFFKCVHVCVKQVNNCLDVIHRNSGVYTPACSICRQEVHTRASLWSMYGRAARWWQQGAHSTRPHARQWCRRRITVNFSPHSWQFGASSSGIQ